MRLLMLAFGSLIRPVPAEWLSSGVGEKANAIALSIVVIPLLWHILTYLIFPLLFILLQYFQIINYSAITSLLYVLYQLFCYIIFYLIRGNSCPVVVSFIILYYKSHSAIVSSVMFVVTVILLWLHLPCPTCHTISVLSMYWACLACTQVVLQGNPMRPVPTPLPINS